MRALAVLLLSITACTPDVLPDTYQCGPEGSCPEGQACNLADNHCVVPSLVQPFMCEPDNASELLAQPDVDGALVGGASLEIESFAAICEAASRS